MVVIGITTFLLGLLFFARAIVLYRRKEEEIYQRILKEKENEIKEKIKQTKVNLQQCDAELKEKANEKQRLLVEKNRILNEISAVNRTKDDLIRDKQKLVDESIEQYRVAAVARVDAEAAAQRLRVDNSIIEYRNQKQTEMDDIQKQVEEKLLKLAEVKEELNNFAAKQEAVKAAVQRAQQIEMEQDFYRVCLEEDEISDISILKDIEHRLYNKEALNKVIYESYLRRPTQEMIKRVLNGKTPSGIYKITYLPTGLSYIGKSVNVANRFVEHIKTSYGIGKIASSSLHAAMGRKGVWNFSFELLEEVDKAQLSEREKFYINFYETNKWGLNQKEGG